VTTQFSLFSESEVPEGFILRSDVVPATDEAALLAALRSIPFRDFEFRGFRGKRRVVSFGWQYDFNVLRLKRADAIPPFLQPLRGVAAVLADVPPAAFEHALVTEYSPGAAIGWHRDRPEFGKVAGISLAASCRLRFRRLRGASWERKAIELPSRSAYVLDGPARSEWEHSIPPVTSLRYSITFRTISGA
jgi:alkylated DNA repair dioxygenase AlkB